MHLIRLPSAGFACWSPLLAGALLLSACSGNGGSEAATALPLPTGHYEGPISYQGTELRVALELRETRPGQLTAAVSFPQVPGLEFDAATARYRAPQLVLEQHPDQAGSITIQAVREGDFLRGVLSWDSVQADFVWVRRGEAAAPGYRETTLAVGTQRLRLLLPDDTLARHPALALLMPPAATAAAARRATYLARHGIAALLVPVAAPAAGPPDSLAWQGAVAALAGLRRQAAVDSGRVGYWGRGPGCQQVAGAAGQRPHPSFVVLEAAPVATREAAQPYQVLNRLRIPALAYYAGLDTTVQAAVSARRLRPALGYRRGTEIRTIPQATAGFLRPARTGPDGQWQWPQPAPEYWTGLVDWLKER
ncbi:dienelactone hydrolase family protein [Hymenobacter rubripertinctus]|uniref:Dienelactone hydrolase domain-containing protein n=1 Tax=Hymenobacter rubripertinctus TaxID=2029981 RepID=A0A418RAB7_9BACT|nr:hypothetical protein [Hymenobacter rubripertinctus]RIY14251.1 hypothetical protein D0T11_00775 [Hymenobacter rubripertinctus]